MNQVAMAQRVRAQVARRYPDLAAVTPSVQRAGPNWVYTFRHRQPLAPGGPELSQVVRVTVDADGRIVKLVASR